MSSQANKAAYLHGKEQKLVVEDAPYYSPGPGQVTIRNYAAAVNPVDAVLQQIGLFISDWPHILGSDSAGIIEEVGSGVNHVKKGDRVFAICSGPFGNKGFEGSKGYGGFQLYTLSDANRVGKLPDHVSFEAGSVFPLTTMTSTIGLFGNEKDRKFLGLDRPALNVEKKNDLILVWGGSSSVGMCAIQLAVAAGYRVITTCSEHNFELCKAVGAEKAFDHKNEKVEEEIVEWLEGKSLTGTIDAISRYGTVERCISLVQKASGTKKVVFVSPESLQLIPDDLIGDVVFGKPTEGIEALLKYVFTDFVPDALKTGSFQAGKPEPELVGHGLDFAQKALDKMSLGVSAKKLVITL